jgi:endonuclease/exonuclease/phosphatase family metal-dependent hydrolase
MRKLSLFICLILISPFSFAAKTATITVMTFNIENGGTQVSFDKVVAAIRAAGADVVGIQEAWGNTEKIAKSLNWKYYSKAQHIISRLPLIEPVAAHHQYLFIEVKPGYVVAMANMHLPDEPYGPVLISHHARVKAVLENERKARLPVALPYITNLSALAKNGMPVFLTGDFNSPSDLDWTTSTVNVVRNHSVAVPWVVTQTAAHYGLKDSFRAFYPDPLQVSGFTWPSMRPFLKNSIDGYNPSNNDLPDRLDFILYGGKARVLHSQVIGAAHSKTVAINITPWPSDHAAVVSRFEVIPVKLNSGTYFKPERDSLPAAPEIFTSKNIFKPGEPVEIEWKNAPGNRYDYISIVPVGATKSFMEDAPRLYTHAKAAGRIHVDARNIKGNWLLWGESKMAKWPLGVGEYDVKLMLDDSPLVLASVRVTVR